MGRIKTKWMKTVSGRLLEAHPEKFTKNFDDNKQALKELGTFDEKGIRNKVAGFLARKKKKGI